MPVKRKRRARRAAPKPPVTKPIMPEFTTDMIPSEGHGKRLVSAKHEAFIENYNKHHNATLAAIEAGYSRLSASTTGSRLANNKQLAARVNAYGQLGLDILAKIAAMSPNHIAAEKAAEALVNRAFGTPKDNDDKNKTAPVTINLNRIEVTPSGKVELTGTSTPQVLPQTTVPVDQSTTVTVEPTDSPNPEQAESSISIEDITGVINIAS